MSTVISTRIINPERFDPKGYTDENSLANALLTKPDKINPIITYYMGKDSDMFPLTFLSEGQVGGVKEVDDVQYEWDVMGRMKHSDYVVSTPYTSGDKPGLNGTPFKVTFKTKWLIEQHGLVSPNGVFVRIMTKPEQKGNNYEYTLQLKEPDAGNYCSLSELVAGTKWTMVGAATVSESQSMGNRSNIQTPGKRTNQISFIRKSYHIAGNVANKTVEVTFNIGGKPTMKWMAFEEWTNQMEFKRSCEEHYWYSIYNRKPDGTIIMKDYDNGKPIPEGAGVYQICKQANYDTYGLTLPLKKLKNTVGDVMYGATDTSKMQVVLYGGLGFLEDFDAAIKSEAGAGGAGFVQALGATQISAGSPGSHDLVYGAYFGAYKHVDGHTIITKHLPLLDYGARAENSPRHPISGKPLTSHSGIFVDQSTYDGVKNVQMFTQRGRSLIRGVEKGMTPVPDSWGGNASPLVSTEQDQSSLHLMASKGVNINRDNHCFVLECVIS